MNIEQEISKELSSLYIIDVQIKTKIYVLCIKDNQHHNLELLK